MSRLALAVGIDHYGSQPLSGCVADAGRIAKLLRKNADKSPNFDCRKLVSGARSRITRGSLRRELMGIFSKQGVDLAAFYFAGHGHLTPLGGLLVTQDYDEHDEGVSMADVIALANNSPAKERLIILDCCHAGSISDLVPAGTTMPLQTGVSVLAACRSDEVSMESNGSGLFTSLLCDALEGGAADVRGIVTIARAYGYVSDALSHWDQDPMFHANLSRLTRLRRAKASVSDADLRKLAKWFGDGTATYDLDPSYEETSPAATPSNKKKMLVLQRLRDARLLVPIGATHLYHAAMQSKSCGLTPLGKFYLRATTAGKI